MTETNNMRVWNAVQTTDPRHTKPVEFGRKFTSIDAHWQIMRMTEQFGPVGDGWGYRTVHTIENFPGVMTAAICDVTIWWRVAGAGERSYGPVRGMCSIIEYDKNGKPALTRKDKPDYDDDAPKKAMTDALTKGLSHLGLSADVFLGLFDDNKYVDKMRRQFDTQRLAANVDELPEMVKLVMKAAKEATSVAQIEEIWKRDVAAINQFDGPHKNLVILTFKECKQALQKKEAEAAAPAATAA